MHVISIFQMVRKTKFFIPNETEMGSQGAFELF